MVKRKAEYAKWVWFNVMWQERKTKKSCQKKWGASNPNVNSVSSVLPSKPNHRGKQFLCCHCFTSSKTCSTKKPLFHLGLNPKMILKCSYPIEINGPFKLEGGGISNLMQFWSTIHKERHLGQFRHPAHWLMRSIFPCTFSYILSVSSGILRASYLKIRHNEVICAT